MVTSKVTLSHILTSLFCSEVCFVQETSRLCKFFKIDSRTKVELHLSGMN